MKKEKNAKKTEKKALTKTQIIASLVETSGLSKKEITKVFDDLSSLIAESLSSKGAGSFTLPGLIKIEKKKVAATPERKHVENPFKKGEFRDIPAKPAYCKVKVRALKGLKDMV